MDDNEIAYAKKVWELAVRSGNWALAAQLAADYLPAAAAPIPVQGTGETK